ncbi:DUF2334 domain-containing protein [Desulfotomaculum copahuensis]|uniref:DUF2334 domain-containing protein n=1 Tax=Desulfotomaculum copahuensis TaxID=1838280 RepID=A0A1B7LKL2_9FIRM|nr:polysaccharide deacetylase family protein [Desulfotomaculum copahuensis]OAT87114.1 hypothetical protein A6M21_02175 [Desulfotomaculum copahuensis]
MFVNVSLHDVTPAYEAEIKCLFDLIRGAGVTRGSMLVVPDFHGRAPLEADAAFAGWLRARAADGWEVVLHGLTHTEAPDCIDRGTCGQKLISRYYTNGEGEFYRLSGLAARTRIESGLAVLTACRLAPAGFVAPAWLLGGRARAVLDEFNFSFTTTLTGIHDLKSGVYHAAPALCFSSRSSWRAALSRQVVPVLAAFWSRRLMVRLVLHPADARQSAILNLAARLLRGMLACRRQVTIGEYLERAKTGREV